MTENEWPVSERLAEMLPLLQGMASPRQWMLWALACARRQQRLMWDARSRDALDAAERYGDGLVSADELIRRAEDAGRTSGQASVQSDAVRADAAATATAVAVIAVAYREDIPRPVSSDGDTAEARCHAIRLEAAGFAASVDRNRSIFAAAVGAAGGDYAADRAARAAAHARSAFALSVRRGYPPRPAAHARSAFAVAAGGGDWKKAEQAEQAAQAVLLRDIVGNPFRLPAPIAPAVVAYNGGAARRLAEAIYDGRRFEDLPVLADLLEEAGCTDAALLGHLRGPGPHVVGCWAVDLVLGRS
jgi:hypothetical protein